MKKIFLLICYIFLLSSSKEGKCVTGTLYSEKTRAYQAYFIELGGNGGFFSGNLDFRLFPHFAFRIGVGAIPASDKDPNKWYASDIGLITMVSYLPFEQIHNLELGIGIT